MAGRLTEPQRLLLAEIKEAGVLYIKADSRYDRTAHALARRGLARIVEPDWSRLRQNGWSAIDQEVV